MTLLTPKTMFAGAALLWTLAGTGAFAQAATPDTTTPSTTAPTTPAVEAAPAPNTPTPNPPAPEPPKQKKRFQLGPEIGVFLPTSSKTRSEFGSAWYSVGIGFGTINQVGPQGQIGFDLQILYQTRDNGHAFVAPVGVSYRKAVSQSGGNTVYVGLTGDLYLADLRSPTYDVHSGLRTGVGGSALAGVNFGKSGYLEARYLLVSRIKSFDLSGLNLTAGYRF